MTILNLKKKKQFKKNKREKETEGKERWKKGRKQEKNNKYLPILALLFKKAFKEELLIKGIREGKTLQKMVKYKNYISIRWSYGEKYRFFIFLLALSIWSSTKIGKQSN